MPPELSRDEVGDLLRVVAEKDSVIEGLAESVSKQADITMELVEEIKKMKMAVNGGSGVSIDWDERIMVNDTYRKTKSPKEMLIEGLIFLSKLEDWFMKYTDPKELKKLLTNAIVWNWKTVLIVGTILFGSSFGERILRFMEGVLASGTP